MTYRAYRTYRTRFMVVTAEKTPAADGTARGLADASGSDDMDENTDGTTWQYRDRASGPGYMQRVTESSALTPEEANRRHSDHIMGCTHCRENSDGSSCPVGLALWRAARAARS